MARNPFRPFNFEDNVGEDNVNVARFDIGRAFLQLRLDPHDIDFFEWRRRLQNLAADNNDLETDSESENGNQEFCNSGGAEPDSEP